MRPENPVLLHRLDGISDRWVLHGTCWEVDPDYTPGRLIECARWDCDETVVATRRQQRFCSKACRDRHNDRIALRRKAGIPLDTPVRKWTRRAA